MELFDVTIWDGSRLVATAENIVAGDERGAVLAGLKAIGARGRKPGVAWAVLVQLREYLEGHGAAPDGIRAFAAEKPRGVRVV